MNIVIKKVNFLVPVRIVFTVNDEEMITTGQMDYANKELYLDDHKDIKEKVFEYLKMTTILPEDGFAIS